MTSEFCDDLADVKVPLGCVWLRDLDILVVDKKTRFKYVQEDERAEPEEDKETVLSFFFLLFCLQSPPLGKKKQPRKRKHRENKY